MKQPNNVAVQSFLRELQKDGKYHSVRDMTERVSIRYEVDHSMARRLIIQNGTITEMDALIDSIIDIKSVTPKSVGLEMKKLYGKLTSE